MMLSMMSAMMMTMIKCATRRIIINATGCIKFMLKSKAFPAFRFSSGLPNVLHLLFCSFIFA